MKASLYMDYDEGASNGSGGSKCFCIDGKIHLTISHSWMDYGSSGDSENTIEVGPCNGSCRHPVVDLDEEQEKLVAKFSNTCLYREITKSEFSYEPFDSTPTPPTPDGSRW